MSVSSLLEYLRRVQVRLFQQLEAKAIRYTLSAPSKRQLYVGSIYLTSRAISEWRQIASRVGLNEDSVILDVGANVGYTSIQMSKGLPGSTVFAFEPAKVNQEHFLVNTSGFKQIKLMPYAVGAITGSLSLSTPTIPSADRIENTGLLTLVSGVQSQEHKQDVNVVTLDSFADSLEPSVRKKIRYIKIDVEGFEREVLLGGHRLFSEVRPTIELELNPSTQSYSGSNISALIDQLSSLGYQPSFAVRPLRTKSLSQLQASSRPFDFVFTPS